MALRNRTFAASLCCGLLSFMWQTSSTLAASGHPSFGFGGGGQLPTAMFALHYLAGGVAMLAVGLLCDRVIRSDAMCRKLAAALAAGACALTVLRIAAPHVSVYYTLYLLSTALGFGANAVVLGGVFAKVPYATRPLCYGFAFSGAVLLRLPLDLYSARAGAMTHTAYILFGSTALLLLSCALLSPPLREVFERVEMPRHEQKGNPSVLTVAVICSLAVYVLFGVFDRLADDTPVSDSYIIYLRIVQIVIPIAAGAVCLRWGHYAAVLGSVTLLGIGTLTYLFSFGGIGGLLCAVANVAGFNLFLGPTRSLFADIGRRAKYPYTVTSLGFATYFLFQILGIPIANLVTWLGREGGLVLYVALFMLAVPMIMLFFHRLKSSHADAQAADSYSAQRMSDINTLGLTRRETEILQLVLMGRLSREIAESLFVSESTVNWHVGNILKKTGVESRAKLIERYGAR